MKPPGLVVINDERVQTLRELVTRFTFICIYLLIGRWIHLGTFRLNSLNLILDILTFY